MRECAAPLPALLGNGQLARTLALSDPYGLYVYKLANAVGSQLPSMAGLLHPPKRNARIGSDHLVDKHHPGFQFVDKALAFFVVVGPGARSQAEAHVVGNANRFILILHSKDRSHWPKEFLAVRR